MIKRANRERRSVPRLTFWVWSLLASTVVALALGGGGAISAHAQDGVKRPGVSGEFVDTRGVFLTSCQDLRSQFPSGDVISVCSLDGEQCAPVSGPAAFALCTESSPPPTPVRDPRPTNPVESKVVVHDSAFSTIFFAGTPTVATLCETSERTRKVQGKPTLEGRNVCVNIFAGDCKNARDKNACGPGDIDIRPDPSPFCNTLKAHVAQSLGDRRIAFWRFTDLPSQPTTEDIKTVTFVCSDFAWKFPNPDELPTEVIEQSTAIESWVSTPNLCRSSTGVYYTCPPPCGTGKTFCQTTTNSFCEPLPWPTSTDSKCDGL
jgi:hypothetical protein